MHGPGIGGPGPQGHGPGQHGPGPAGAVPGSIKAQGPLSEAEKMGVDLIPRLMQSYYRVIRKKIEDMVPKAIVAFLVKASKE